MQRALVPVPPQADTAANLPERLVESHENDLFEQSAAHGGRLVPHGSVGDANDSFCQKLGCGGFGRKQTPGCSAVRFGKALQRDSEDLASWKELHAGDKGSGVIGDEGCHSKTVWTCPE